MTDTQKRKIAELRISGMGYAAIGKRLDLSADTVKSYCYRNGLKDILPVPQVTDDVIVADSTVCRQCGKPVKQTPKSKRRYFCSNECRLAWWHEHPEKLKRTATYAFICERCGKTFTAYGNSHRKYCSHTCYVQARFKGGDFGD